MPRPQPKALLTIGALSNATGIPAPTLRTWERRYGVPAALRTEGGHRLYEPGEVERLQLVSRVLERGHRANQALRADLETLRSWAGQAQVEVRVAPSGGWVELARSLDGPALDARLRHEWARLGAAAFLGEVAAPFAQQIGDAWMEGRLAIHQEHFATHRLLGLLHTQWRELDERNGGPVGVFATLPGELHEVGLAMTAITAASAGWRVTYLGCDCPLADLVASTRASGASALFLSVSAVAEPAMAESQVAWIRAQIAAEAAVVVGGEGAPEVDGVSTFSTIEELREWLASRY